MIEEEYQNLDKEETDEWLEAFDEVVNVHGRNRASKLLNELYSRRNIHVVRFPFSLNTPYVNPIRKE